jgi:hypothetical protein
LQKVAGVCICLTCEARVNSAKGTTTNMMKHLRHRESIVVFTLYISKAGQDYVDSLLDCHLQLLEKLASLSHIHSCTPIPISSFVDRHRFDANPDPDPTFYFEADPDPASSFTHQKFPFDFN